MASRKLPIVIDKRATQSCSWEDTPLPHHSAPAPQRRQTGRDKQFNVKANAETIRRFFAISDAYEWPSGLTMEHAIALERELARESRPKGRDAPSPLGE